MNRLHDIRKERGVTLRSLSSRVGVSPQGINYAEKNRLTPELAEKVSNALNCNVFELLGDDVYVIVPEREEDICVLIKDLENKLKNLTEK